MMQAGMALEIGSGGDHREDLARSVDVVGVPGTLRIHAPPPHSQWPSGWESKEGVLMQESDDAGYQTRHACAPHEPVAHQLWELAAVGGAA
jgi:hypothetical protein